MQAKYFQEDPPIAGNSLQYSNQAHHEYAKATEAIYQFRLKPVEYIAKEMAKSTSPDIKEITNRKEEKIVPSII